MKGGVYRMLTLVIAAHLLQRHCKQIAVRLQNCCSAVANQLQCCCKPVCSDAAKSMQSFCSGCTVRQQAVYGDAAAGREGLIAGCWRCRGINGCLEHY